MDLSIETIIFYILLLDAVSAVVIAHQKHKWYKRHFKVFSRLFPLTKGWTILYLVLVLFIGYLIFT